MKSQQDPANAQEFIDLANAMPQMVWVSLADGTIIYYNDRIRDYANARQNADGSWVWHAVVHPDDLDLTMQTWQRSLTTGRPYEIEHRLLMKNNEYRWHLNRALPQYDALGKISRWYGTATDIHKQKEAERALRISEAEFRASFENSSVGMVQANPDTGRFLRVNDAYCNMVGYSRDELLKISFSDITHPEDREHDLLLFRKMVTGETREYQSEKRYIRKNGDIIWVVVTANLVYDEMGMVSRTSAIIRDITKKKKAEDALMDSEAKFKAFLHYSPLLAWSKDEEGRYVYLNSSYEKRFNVSLEHWQGLTDADLRPPEVAKLFRDNDLKVLHSGEPILEVEHTIEADGHVSYWQSFKFVYTDTVGRRYVGGIGYEITQQRQAEEASRKAREQLELTFKNVPTGIMLYNKERKLVFVNEMAARFTGFTTAEEMMNTMTLNDVRVRSSIQFDVYNDEGILQTPELSPVQRCFNDRAANQGVYKVVYRSDGSTKWVFYVCNPLIDEHADVDMVIATITDITIQREAENMLMQEQRDSAERLEKLVAQRTKELQESNDGLQQFAHVASHDLKEPVRKIKIFGNRLIEEFKDALPERAFTYLKKIESAADRMYTMIEGVLRYSSFEAMQKAIETVDLQELVSSIEQDLELMIQMKQGRIEYRDLPRVQGVSVLLHQLFYNLINNSLKFSKPGVPPIVKLSSSVIEKENQPFICIKVEDNGIGFESENTQKIFHTFTRLHPKDVFEGTGLGLALCRKIVEKHNGMIEASSKLGEGSVFTVMLPVVSAPSH